MSSSRISNLSPEKVQHIIEVPSEYPKIFCKNFRDPNRLYDARVSMLLESTLVHSSPEGQRATAVSASKELARLDEPLL